MSENNKQEGFFKRIFNTFDNKFRSKGDKKHASDNSDLEASIPIAPKRRSKQYAPQPPTELTVRRSSAPNEPRRNVNNHAKTGGVGQKQIDEIDTMFAGLTITECDNDSQIVSAAQDQPKSRPANSPLQKKIQRRQSSKADVAIQVHRNLPEKLIDYNGIQNQNIIENYQGQNRSENNYFENTPVKNFDHKNVSGSVISNNEPTRAENAQVDDNELKKISENNEQTLEIKNSSGGQSDIILENVQLNSNIEHNEVKCNSSQILESETHKLEKERFDVQEEDKTNKSLNEEIENKQVTDEALEQINSVMEEVENIKLDIQKLTDPEQFFIIESELTNAMIKLDGIQASRNELVKQERKKGIIMIQDLFKLLDKQVNRN